MENSKAFVLVPMVGESPSDILQEFDGKGANIRASAQACFDSLRQGTRPWLEQASPYEALASAEETPLALQAAAREANRVGLDRLAQVVTTTDVRQRQEMGQFLASTMAPEPDMAPRPSGPSVNVGPNR